MNYHLFYNETYPQRSSNLSVAANELLCWNNATNNLTYDLNGNLAMETVGGVTTTYTWDSRNRLTGLSKNEAMGSDTIYDAYDGDLLTAITDPKGLTSLTNWYDVQWTRAGSAVGRRGHVMLIRRASTGGGGCARRWEQSRSGTAVQGRRGERVPMAPAWWCGLHTLVPRRSHKLDWEHVHRYVDAHTDRTQAEWARHFQGSRH